MTPHMNCRFVGASRSSFGNLLCYLVYCILVLVSCVASTCTCLTGICHGGHSKIEKAELERACALHK